MLLNAIIYRFYKEFAEQARTWANGVMAERVGFEPTVRLHAQRFSRPSRSTTLAPLRGHAYRGVFSGGQQRRRGWEKPPEFGVSGVDLGLSLRIFRPPSAGLSDPPCSFMLSGIWGPIRAIPQGVVGQAPVGELKSGVS